MAQSGQTMGPDNPSSPMFERMRFDTAPDVPTDLSKTELAKNLVNMTISAAGMVAGVQVNGIQQLGGPRDRPVADGAIMSAYHEKEMKKQLEVHFSQYEKACLLVRRDPSPDGKNTVWTTTPKFEGLKVLFAVYNDIEEYAKNEGISNAGLERLGCSATMEIHRNIDKKDCRDPITHLWRCCKATGVENVTTTDLACQFDEMPYNRVGRVLLENALSVEEQPKTQQASRPANPQETSVAPVLGRILVLAAMCGIRTIQISDIPILLAKAGLFETVMRARIAQLRNHHPSQILNLLLFGGKTETHGNVFVEEDGAAYTVVGKMDKPDSATFVEPWKSCNCLLTLRKKAQYAPGSPIYMPIAWSRLLKERKVTVQAENSKRTPALESINFTVVEASGALFAQPSGQGTCFSREAAKERHHGGVVGSTGCSCTGAAAKVDLAKASNYNEKLKIPKVKKPRYFLHHASDISTGEVVVLDFRGDWPTGIFYMQALPQSSYMKGKDECVRCAIRNAARIGCPQVIVCDD